VNIRQPLLLALLPLRALCTVVGWTSVLAALRWLDVVPFVVGALSVVTSRRNVEEAVRVPLDGVTHPPHTRLAVERHRRRHVPPSSTRPLRVVQIADPHLVSKIVAGREQEIRPCVGATHCQSQYRPSCLHNPSTGRESILPHEIPRSPRAGRKVVVVGGGPAGLEAARVSALRGHRVVLLEAARELGGQLLMACRASWRRDLRGIIDWRRAELDRLGVAVRLNILAERADVLAEAPDVVIIATGGTPDIEWIDGVEHVTSAWDAISGAVPIGADVIVYDGTGRHPAPQVVETVAAQARQVSYFSIDNQMAQELTYAERVIWKKRAYELGVPMQLDHQIEKVERSGNRLRVVFRNLATGGRVERVSDQLIVEHGTSPADALYQELRQEASNAGVTDIDALLALHEQPTGLGPQGGFELHRVGDAVASRNVQAAILDSMRLCRAL